MLNVIEAKNCYEGYLKSLKMLLDSKHLVVRNLFMQINSTDDNYIVSLPHVVDSLPWYLRVNSDVVEGELGVGVGLDVRYSPKRLGRVKGHGAYDWGYRDETGRENPILGLILDRDEIFPNIGRVGGNGQLHYVTELLKLEPTSDKGIVQLWNWKKDLLEYTKRKYYSPSIVGEELWSDSQHQRIPCPVSWHFTSTPEGIDNNVYSRSLVWDGHIHDDIFRFSEASRWVGGNLGKPSGKLIMTINKLWNVSTNREVMKNLYEYWSENKSISSYYPNYHSNSINSELFLRDWELKEFAEQDYRLGAFYEGDKKLNQISSAYYRDWVKVMRVAEMTIAHRTLGRMFHRGLHSRATKQALGYIEDKGLFNSVAEIEGVFKVQTVQWVVNYLLRSSFDTEDYMKYIELLPEELQQLTLLSSLDKVKKPIVEEILSNINPKYKSMSFEFFDESTYTKPIFVKENEMIRNPIKLDEKPKILTVIPYIDGKADNVTKYPELIKESVDNGETEIALFPVEPFSNKEKNRHLTENAMRACLDSGIPMLVETRAEVPEWAIDFLSRDKKSEIRIQLNTLDKTKWSYIFSNSATPDELFNSLLRCFNGGVYTVLKITNVVPGIITPFDVFKLVDSAKNFSDKMEFSFASFDEDNFDRLKKKLPKKYAQTLDYYERVEDRYFVKQDYREKFIRKLLGFVDGLKVKLNIIKEVDVKDGEVVGKLFDKKG